MLYTPPAFRFDDLTGLHDHIENSSLAMVVTVGSDGPIISHLPLLLDRSAGQYGALIGHFAKANPQTTLSKFDSEAVAVFPGADAYVSPRWYASKAEHGRVVPTWNYVVVHARGRLVLFDDPARLRAAVDRLTTRHEGSLPNPWSTDDAPQDFIEAQLSGIVGVEMVIERLEGKRKLSQNRRADDHAGVIAGLSASHTPSDRELADRMRDRSKV